MKHEQKIQALLSTQDIGRHLALCISQPPSLGQKLHATLAQLPVFALVQALEDKEPTETTPGNFGLRHQSCWRCNPIWL